MADLNLDSELDTTGDLDSAAQMLAAGEEAKEEAKERGEKECKELSTRMESCVEDNTLTEDLKLGTTGDLDSAAQLLAAGKEAKEEERGKREKELSTRMEPCVEDSTLTEENCKENDKHSELSLSYYQKQGLVVNHLFGSVKVSKYENQLMYGLPIQIQSEVIIPYPEYKPKPILQLSVLITDVLIETENMLQLNEKSLVTLSYDNTRVRRNVFTCVSLAKKGPRTPVLYGEDLFIRLFDSEGPELYLTGNVPHLDNFGETKGKIRLSLTKSPDRFAKFRIVDLDPDRMMTLRDTPVPTFAIVSISQTATNQLVAVDPYEQITCVYAFDHPVYCYTCQDSLRRITSENYWKFVTQEIDEDTGEESSESESDDLVSNSDDAAAAGGAEPSTSE